MLIKTATSEIIIVRPGGKRKMLAFCSSCGKEVEMLTLDEAISVSGKPARELVRLGESGTIHALETSSGHLLICVASARASGARDVETRDDSGSDDERKETKSKGARHG